MGDKSHTTELLINIKHNYLRMIVLAFLSFISSIVISRMLGPNAYGTYSYMIWFTSTFVTLLGLGLGGTITKFLPMYYFKGQFNKSTAFLKALFIIQIITIIVISTILVMSFSLWKNVLRSMDTNEIKTLVYLAITNILPLALLTLLTNSVQAIQRFDIYSKVAIKAQILQFILNILIIILFHKIEYLLIIWIIISSYQVILYAFFLNKDLKSNNLSISTVEDELIDKKRIFNYSKYMYINNVWQQVVFTRSEFLIIGIYSGPKQIAIYGIAYGLINMIGLVFSPVMNVLTNFFSVLVAKKEINLLETTVVSFTKYFIVILLFLLTYAFAFSGNIINLVYSSDYSDVVVSFLIMLSGYVVLQGISVGASLSSLYEKQKFIVNMGLVAGIINIVLDFVLIPKWGSVGAAIANTTTQVASSIISYIYIIKITDFKFNLSKLIPGVLLCVVFCCFLIYTQPLYLRLLITTIYTSIYYTVLRYTKVFNLNEMKKLIHLLK